MQQRDPTIHALRSLRIELNEILDVEVELCLLAARTTSQTAAKRALLTTKAAIGERKAQVQTAIARIMLEVRDG